MPAPSSRRAGEEGQSCVDEGSVNVPCRECGERRSVAVLGSERGGVTVFLALLFLLFLGAAFVVLEGVRQYETSALAEDAAKGAGENVLANYSKALFKEYHVFFLDPREREHILSDGKEAIDGYFSAGSFYHISCTSLAVTEEKTAVDADGLYLRHQIREWMRFREREKAKDAAKATLKKLVSQEKSENAAGKERVGELVEAEKEEQEAQEKSQEEKAEADKKQAADAGASASAPSAGSGNETGSASKTGEGSDADGSAESGDGSAQSTAKKPDPKTVRERLSWKELKETVEQIMKTGVLYYAADAPEKLSVQSMEGGDLPSSGVAARIGGADDGNFSFASLAALRVFFSEKEGTASASTLLGDEYFLLAYIEENFRHYGDGREKYETVLAYETEYLLAGQSEDLANLKRTANQILRLRFVTNYAAARRNAALQKKVSGMAFAVCGVFGMPQAVKPVEILITAMLSYGESLLELHALLSGEEISLKKSAATWNLQPENAVRKLWEKSGVKKGKVSVSYTDFLKLLLLKQGSSKALCYRMMDIMQENTALSEPGFLMRESLFSWKWKGTIASGKWFPSVGLFGLSSGGQLKIAFERQNNY